MASECGSCKAPVIWTLTPAGSKAPIDFLSDREKGNTLVLAPRGLTERLSVVLSGPALRLAREKGLPLHMNHWATCPDRAEWRRKQDEKKAAAGA